MALMGGGRVPKITEPEPSAADTKNFKQARNQSQLTSGKAINNLSDKLRGPIKGLSGVVVTQNMSRDKSNFMGNFVNESLADIQYDNSVDNGQKQF